MAIGRLLKKSLVYLLVASLIGFPDLASWAQTAATDSAPPIIRHLPPPPPYLGETLLIRAVVDDESDIVSVNFRYRVSGEKNYEKIPMTPVSENAYEAVIPATQDLKPGIEYYIEADDQVGHQGADGAQAMPYFVEVREKPVLAFGATKKKIERPWWRNPWFWVGAVLAAGGGTAAAVRSEARKQGSGTVIVQ